jgi:starvation-inducible DNA-binding protein
MTTMHDSKLQAQLITPSDLDAATRALLGAALHQLTADVVALYFKTKAYHWHVYGAHFKEYHELFDEQAVQVFAMVDVLAERA